MICGTSRPRDASAPCLPTLALTPIPQPIREINERGSLGRGGMNEKEEEEVEEVDAPIPVEVVVLETILVGV